MPGFLANYTQVTTLYFDDEQLWWAKVKRFPRRGDAKAAQDKLIAPVMRYVGGEDDGEGPEKQQKAETSGRVDTGAFQNEMVARSLIDWNLTDENDVPIPLGTTDPVKGPDDVRYAAVDILPDAVFEKILNAIEGAGRKKAPRRDAAFREAGAKSADVEGVSA